MNENISGSPIFADRYRFQPVNADWDVGRSGLTHLVFDMKKERLGVIKRAELKSPRAVEGLKNEVAALLDLKGQGVPEVYDTGEAEYGSKNYFYMVMEYIEGIRIEKDLASLSATERTEILIQLFALLAKAHKMGIVNGDIDLKHLFWNKEKKHLTVIDWGNAKLDVNQKNKSEFSYDLARSAEIIFSLVTRKGHPSATGSLALPANSALIPGVAPIPEDFRALCKWAPRTPSDGVQSPYSAQDLLETAKNWRKAVRDAKPYQQKRRSNWGLRLLFGGVIIAAVFLGISPNSPLNPILFPKTPTPTEAPSETAPPPTETELPPTAETITATSVPASTDEATFTPTSEPSPTFTPEATTTSIPTDYANVDPIYVFDEKLPSIAPGTECWKNEDAAAADTPQGFSRRGDNFWRFGTTKEQPINSYIQTDLYPCLVDQKVSALAVNVWITRLELERNDPNNPGAIDPGKEFGIFLEDTNKNRLEYTFWVDMDESIHLRIRNNGEITSDETILIINKGVLNIEGTFPRVYSVFPMQIFLEIDNQGLNILYLKEVPIQGNAKVDDINPSQMTRIDKVVLPSLNMINKVGLIGYGGETQTVIWPLVFYGE